MTSTDISTSDDALAPGPGVTPATGERRSGKLFSDDLVDRGIVGRAAMEAALRESRSGRSFNEILVDAGEISEDALSRAIAGHYGLDHLDLDQFAVDREAAILVLPALARRLEAIPVAILPGGALVVALHDPNGSLAVGEFSAATGRLIQIAVASRMQIVDTIDRIFKGSIDDGRMVTAATPEARPVAEPEEAEGDVAHGLIALLRDAQAALAAAEARASAAEIRAAVAEERARAAEARVTEPRGSHPRPLSVVGGTSS